MNGRKLFILFGLLRNSTKIAAQFLGLGQSSQKAPEKDEKLKQRPYCSQTPIRGSVLWTSVKSGFNLGQKPKAKSQKPKGISFCH